jgi:subtilisin family serine protease
MVVHVDIKYLFLAVLISIFLFFPGVQSVFSGMSPQKNYEIFMTRPLETAHQVNWYEGPVKKRAWMAPDEIALFTKREFPGRIDISEIRNRYQATAEIYEQNDFVTFVKGGQNLNPKSVGERLASMRDNDAIGFAGPVFYTSFEKDPKDRIVLTGKLIVRYQPDCKKHRIQALESEFGLSEKTSAGFKTDTFIYSLNDAFNVLNIANALHNSGEVLYAYPDRLMKRATRAIPDDSLFPDQWHLYNTGQGEGTVGEDVDITAVWDVYLGTPNEVIAIVDDGLEINHEDLRDNVIDGLSWDYRYGDPDPTAGDHGTSCAGVAAARGFINSIGVTGVAPNCGLVGYRLIDTLTDANEADAMMRNNQVVDIYSNSWGPYDDAWEPEGPGPLMLDALAAGAANGRGGLGSIFVWAGGNGDDKDNSNYDGYANSRYTIAVAASNNYGIRSYYSEKGANILVNAPSDGGSMDITTTDRTGMGDYHDNYTNSFGGTSSATPLVSGIVALMLQANPDLTWRDVQHILMSTAEKNDPDDEDWSHNSAGYHINHKYGFGRINADSAVASALTWVTATPEISTEISANPAIPIPDDDETGVSHTISISKDIRIEFVEVFFTAGHDYWGDLEITLTSPGGTDSILAEQHNSKRTDGYTNWRFGTVRHFGETSAGNWTLVVKDLDPVYDGIFEYWKLKIYGTEILKGDLNNDGTTDLTDLIFALRILTGADPGNDIDMTDDIDGDSKIGMAEAIFIMGVVSDIR